MVTWENYEEYLMMHADGELRPDEEQALLAFVEAHPELKKEMAAYELTRFTPDAAQVFTAKDSLLKPIPQKRIIAFPSWIKYGIAASIAVLISITILNTPTPPAKTGGTGAGASQQIVGAAHQNNTSPLPQIAVNETKNTHNGRQEPRDTIAKTQRSNTNNRKYALNSGRSGAKTINTNIPIYIDVNKLDPITTREEIFALPVTSTKQLPVSVKAFPAPPLPEIPAYALETKRPSGLRAFWDKVPLDKRNKKQIESVAGFVVSACVDAAHVKEDLEDKSINLQIKDNQLFISIN